VVEHGYTHDLLTYLLTYLNAAAVHPKFNLYVFPIKVDKTVC